MFRNKKTLLVTLPLALGIWGYITYKVYHALQGDEVALPAAASEIPLAALRQEQDTFTLFNNYRDPFLYGTRSSGVAHPNTNTTSHPRPKVKATPAPVKSWPVIVYSGIVKNQSNATALVLLRINGRLHTLKQGEMSDGVKVVSFSNNEVVLLYEKEKKIFLR